MDTVWKNTTQKKNVQVLFACDNDDNLSQDYVKSIIMRYHQMDVQLHKRPRTEFINNDYYNWLAKKATGDMLWILADDLQLIYNGWDTKFAPIIEWFQQDKPDKIYCVSIRDNTPPPSHRLPKFPCFPMFPKEVLQYLGYLLYYKVPNWGADYIAYATFKPIERLLEIKDVNYINHVSYHTKQVAVDATAKRIGDIFNRLKMIPQYNTDRILSEEVPPLRQKICEYIKTFNYEEDNRRRMQINEGQISEGDNR